MLCLHVHRSSLSDEAGLHFTPRILLVSAVTLFVSSGSAWARVTLSMALRIRHMFFSILLDIENLFINAIVFNCPFLLILSCVSCSGSVHICLLLSLLRVTVSCLFTVVIVIYWMPDIVHFRLLGVLGYSFE